MLRRGPGPAGPARVRHSLPCVLALCTAAVLCGHSALEDVTAWVHAASQEVLTAAGARRNGLSARVAPHPETVVRIFTALGAQGVAHHAGAYLARRAHPGPVTFPLAGPGWLPAIAQEAVARAATEEAGRYRSSTDSARGSAPREITGVIGQTAHQKTVPTPERNAAPRSTIGISAGQPYRTSSPVTALPIIIR